MPQPESTISDIIIRYRNALLAGGFSHLYPHGR